MKQIRRRISSSLYTFPFLLFIYILILVSSFFLAANGFDGVFSATFFNTPRGILLLVVGPLGLLVFLSLSLFGILSESFHQGPPNRLRLRLFLIFILLLFSATLPQTIIVCRYVGTALGTWFNRSIQVSLESGENFANLYIAERYQAIEKVTGRFLNGLAISNYRSRPTDWMNEMRLIDSRASSCQIYSVGSESPDPVLVMEIGDSLNFIPRENLNLVTNGFYTLTEGDGVFRYGQIVRYSDYTYVCVYTSLIPSGFFSRLDALKEAAAQSRIIDTLKPYLPLMGIWIYVMFLLPSILMVIIFAWFISSRIAEPVRALVEASTRLAENDPSFIVIPHSRDELGEMAILLNSMADSHREKKKPDKKAVIRLQ